MRRHDPINPTSLTEHPKGAILETCDLWDTDHNSDNWEPEYMTTFVTWQLRLTLDSICNSCYVYFVSPFFCRFVKLYILFYTGLLPFVPLKETHLEIPMPSIFYDNNYRFSPIMITRDEHVLIVSGFLRPTWVLESCPNGASAWRTILWWAQPCSVISIKEESTHICGSSTRRKSMPGK